MQRPETWPKYFLALALSALCSRWRASLMFLQPKSFADRADVSVRLRLDIATSLCVSCAFALTLLRLEPEDVCSPLGQQADRSHWNSRAQNTAQREVDEGEANQVNGSKWQANGGRICRTFKQSIYKNAGWLAPCRLWFYILSSSSSSSSSSSFRSCSLSTSLKLTPSIWTSGKSA